MVLEALLYSPFNHLTVVLATETSIEISHCESFRLYTTRKVSSAKEYEDLKARIWDCTSNHSYLLMWMQFHVRLEFIVWLKPCRTVLANVRSVNHQLHFRIWVLHRTIAFWSKYTHSVNIMACSLLYRSGAPELIRILPYLMLLPQHLSWQQVGLVLWEVFGSAHAARLCVWPCASSR